MEHAIEHEENVAQADSNVPRGRGYLLPLAGAIVLALLWGAYTTFDAWGILTSGPL